MDCSGCSEKRQFRQVMCVMVSVLVLLCLKAFSSSSLAVKLANSNALKCSNSAINCPRILQRVLWFEGQVDAVLA